MSAIFVLILRILLTLSLYGFLGWAVYIIWRDLQLTKEMVGGQSVPTILLVLQNKDGQDSRQYNLPEVIIGRDPACQCVVQDETVSARHARLSYHHKQWWVEDLQSTNGTYLNEERVSTATVIISGDELRCGKVLVNVEI